MTTFRIYTEKKNVKAVSQIVSEHYGGFSIFFGLGCWEGKREKSMCIEIITEPKGGVQRTLDYGTVRLICKKIRGLNRQDAVMFTTTTLDKMEVI